jgi:Ca2+-binding RTX toxin-like protein
MQRAAIIFGLAVMLVFAAAGAVLAAELACKKVPCIGYDDPDVMYERAGDNKKDNIFGLKGGDVIDANTFFSDRDVLHGQEGRDRLLSNDGDGRDVVKGGPGRDYCVVDKGDQRRSCEVERVTRTAGTSSVQGDLSAAAFE